jgi:hypothetical protein
MRTSAVEIEVPDARHDITENTLSVDLSGGRQSLCLCPVVLDCTPRRKNRLAVNREGTRNTLGSVVRTLASRLLAGKPSASHASFITKQLGGQSM